MRKKLFIILIIIAIPVYLWDIVLVSRFFIPAPGRQVVSSSHSSSTPLSVPDFRVVHYVKKGRSPFVAHTPKPIRRVKTTPKPKHRPQPREKVKLPSITITGIMWNPDNPLVMLSLPGGSTTAAGRGKTVLDGVEIKTIERNRVLFVYKGEKFWVEK